MRKYFILILALLGSLATEAKVAAYDSGAALQAARNDLANWMKYLPEDVFVAHVSVPGTHDSATGEGWKDILGAHLSTTQATTLDEQLAAGIRAFDFRPGLLQQYNGDYYLNCNHGAAATSLRFRDAIRKLTSYLDSHPSEFMVIHLFRGNLYNEDSEEKRAVFNRLTNEIFNEGDLATYFIGYDPELRVSDIRGKIVVFRRDRMLYADIHKAGNLTEWPGDKDLWAPGSAALATNASDPLVTGRIRVTDVSSPKTEAELQTELTSITNLFRYNASEKRPNQAKKEGGYSPEWTMIFTSGAYPIETTEGYLNNATYTNPLLTGLITGDGKTGPTGIVFSDWVLVPEYRFNGKTYKTAGDALVRAIIENNFAYIKDFILDDELFGSPNSVPQGECFLRNAGSGLFLSCGGEWGVRASVGKYPIPITAVLQPDGKYVLQTTFRRKDRTNYIGADWTVDSDKALEFSVTDTGRRGVFIFSYTGGGTPLAMAPVEADMKYADGTDVVVDGVAFRRDDPYQQWRMVTAAELKNERSPLASAADGVDLSFMIHGNSFRPDDSENGHWVAEELGGQMRTEIAGTNRWNDCRKLLRVYNNSFENYRKDKYRWRIAQTVGSLPDGEYTLSFDAYGCNLSLTDASAFAFTANGTDLRPEMTTGSTMLVPEEIISLFSSGACSVTHPVTVRNNTLSIVISGDAAKAAAATEFAFTNLRLKYFGPGNGGVSQPRPYGDGPVTVYSIDGVPVGKGNSLNETLAGLRPGVYIISGKNGVIKIAL